MSSSDDISLSRYFKTILTKQGFPSIEMPLRQLFESPGLSTPASLSCLRGYYSNMALGTVKGSIKRRSKLGFCGGNFDYEIRIQLLGFNLVD